MTAPIKPFPWPFIRAGLILFFFILFSIIFICCFSGCTVVSANRVFPKFTWYWSQDAQMQRQSDRDYQKMFGQDKTNSIPGI